MGGAPFYDVRTFKTIPTLQKQVVGCFNHRVVSLVADKLERQWLWEVHFCFLKAGRYKTWTLNSGLDYGPHYGLDFELDLMF